MFPLFITGNVRVGSIWPWNQCPYGRCWHRVPTAQLPWGPKQRSKVVAPQQIWINENDHISKGLTCCISCSDVLLDSCILYKIHNTANTVDPPYFSTMKWRCWSVYQNTGTNQPYDGFLFHNATNWYPLLNQRFTRWKLTDPW